MKGKIASAKTLSIEGGQRLAFSSRQIVSYHYDPTADKSTDTDTGEQFGTDRVREKLDLLTPGPQSESPTDFKRIGDASFARYLASKESASPRFGGLLRAGAGNSRSLNESLYSTSRPNQYCTMTQPQEISEKRPPGKWYTRTQSEIDLLLSMQHRKRSGITINPTESER